LARTIPGQISPGHSQDGQLQDKKPRRPIFLKRIIETELETTSELKIRTSPKNLHPRKVFIGHLDFSLDEKTYTGGRCSICRHQK